MKSENNVAYKLIENGSLVSFKIVEQNIETEPDGINSYVYVKLQMTDTDGNASQDTVEWGAFGFIFVLAVLSFEGARPRGMSNIDFNERDSFTVADLFDCLEFAHGKLYFDADYIRGRCMKTRIEICQDGMVTITTHNRGQALIHWLERLQGKKKLQLIK